MVKQAKSPKEQTANEITDVKDIHSNLLYTKSGYVIGFLRLYPIAIELLSEREKESICSILSANFRAEKEPFTIFSIPRTVDMEVYLNFLVEKNDEEMGSPTKKMLLNAMMKEAAEKVLNSNNFEHQFYIKVWAPAGTNTERILEERLQEMERRYAAAGNRTKRLQDVEIMKMCNLYTNCTTAVMENYQDNVSYIPLPTMKREGKEKGS